jgi:FAD:protein FMN transferase
MISVADIRARRRWALPAALLATLILAACSRPPAEPVRLSGMTMGTTWTVQASTLPRSMSAAELGEQIETLLDQVNDEMSTWREDSDISRFNRLPAGERMDIPRGFATVLGLSLELADQSGGAFDPTVGPLVNLWGFGPDGRVNQAPDAETRASARARVGYQRLSYERGSGTLTQPGELYLDFSAIAKGWGVDVVAEHLIDLGIDGFLVDIGGDMRMQGTRPDGRAWRIAIERPVPGTREIFQVIQPGNAAIATSGTYRQYFESGERRYSHTIDPRIGFPVEHPAISITVIADNATWADGLATALGVLDPDEAYEWAVERNLAVLWILEQDDELTERYTPGFAPLLD